MRSLEDRYGERVEAWSMRAGAWIDRPHPRLARYLRRVRIAAIVPLWTLMVAWAVVHAIRIQSHPLTDMEFFWFACGAISEFLTGVLFLYGLAYRAICLHWRPVTYRRVEMLAVLVLLVVCPLVVLAIHPPLTAPGPMGLVAVPAVVLWLTMLRDLTRRAWRARS